MDSFDGVHCAGVLAMTYDDDFRAKHLAVLLWNRSLCRYVYSMIEMEHDITVICLPIPPRNPQPKASQREAPRSLRTHFRVGGRRCKQWSITLLD